MKDPYRHLAKYYDRFVEPANGGVRTYVLKRFPPQKNERVLEVGCGTGTNLAFYQKSGSLVSGIDLSQGMLKQAKRKLGANAGLVHGDASRMPFADDSFDTVLAMLTLHEMPPQIRLQVLNEMIRVSKREGRILLTDYHPGPLRWPWGFLYKVIILFYEISAGREHFRNYRHFLQNGGLSPLLEKLPVRIERQKVIAEGNMVVLSLKKK